jgi:proline iminopeptidase
MLKLFKQRLPKPIKWGYLPEEDGHRVYYEQYGNLNGQTIVSFHGSPGSSRPSNAIRFDLKKHNVILFDQRGCGKSVPAFEVKNNTTEDILKDAKRILDHLKITDKVVSTGASWGSTLALLFAEEYPDLISKIAIFNIHLGSNEADDWFSDKVKSLYPDLYEEFIKDVPQNKDIYKHYYELISSKKKSDVKKAMDRFARYEMALGRLDTSDIQIDYDFKDYFKMFLYYISNRYFIEDNKILKDAKKIQDIPCLIVHNRLDLLCPLSGAYDLHKALKKSKLIIKPVLGHGCRIMPVLKDDIAEFLS